MRKGLESMTKSAQLQKRKLRASAEGETLVSRLREERSQNKEEVLVWGPYRDGPKRYRLKISEKGEVRNVCYRTEKDAETVKASLLKRVEDRQERTIGEAIAGFCQYLAETGSIKPKTCQWYLSLLAWLPQKALLSSVTAEQAQQLYRELTTRVAHTGRPLAAATHHEQLQISKRLYEWAKKGGFCRHNPFAEVQRIGRENVGKKQLRIDEARRFEAVCLKQARLGDREALGALLMIYLGLRQSEVTARVGRDIDDDGRVLWVPSGKTVNAKRRLKIPEQIRPLILELVQSTKPDVLLFYPTRHKGFHGWYYNEHVRRLCGLAGVPEVCPHSLRGLHATLALEGGATSDAVARALGHGSFAMTARHYATESSVDAAKSNRVAEALALHSEPRINGSETMNTLASLLKELPAERLPELLTYLRSQRSAELNLDDKPHT